MADFWHCFTPKHAVLASKAHPIVTKHLARRHARRVRRIRRAAGAAIVCIAVSAPLAAAGIPFFVSPPLTLPPTAATGGIGSGNAPTTAETSPAASQPIPEPGSAVLVATAVAAAIVIMRRYPCSRS